MNLIQKKEKRKINWGVMMTALVTMALLIMAPMNAFAAAQVQGKINNLYSIVTTIITAAGAIVLAWVFLSLHLPTSREIPHSRRIL